MLPFGCIQWLITLLVCIFMWQYWNYGTRIAECSLFKILKWQWDLERWSFSQCLWGTENRESWRWSNNLRHERLLRQNSSTLNIISFADRPWKLYSMNSEISKQDGSLILATNTGIECLLLHRHRVRSWHRREDRLNWSEFYVYSFYLNLISTV